jgi:serine/threonine protein kinase/tetratricopeptide (TPR) repeat protein
VVVTAVATPPPGAPALISSDVTVVAGTGMTLDVDLPTFVVDSPFVGTQSTTQPHSSSATDATVVHPAAAAPAQADRPADTGPLTPGKPFGSRYHIIRLLGAGGMGAVYHAWDEDLGVAVAIKVIRPEAMRDPAAARDIERRFKHELLLAREVTHKNVVRIHDLGEIDGIRYITMSYIDGLELASMLKRDGRLPVPKALPILRSVLEGLVAAHAAGVVHRDLKPANIIVGKKGDALIMDFGIARSMRKPEIERDAEPDVERDAVPEVFRRRAAAADAGVTTAGTMLGTIHYMAPEQARSEDVDQRADIYAMGLILYDMLLGRRRAESATSAIAELEERMKQPPPALRSVAPEIPAAVEAIVSRCLDPDPSKRFQNTPDLVAALDKLDENGNPLPVKRVIGLPMMAAIVVVLVGLAGGLWYYQRQFIPPPVHDPVSVVIADIQNSTNDPAFDHTLEQTFRRALEGAGFITAYDRTRVRAALGVAPPPKLDEAAARQLAVNQGLTMVLAGSIERRGTGYEVSVTARQALAGKEVAAVSGRAASRDQVLDTVTKLANSVRQALGDETSDPGNLVSMKSISTASLEVASLHSTGVDLASRGKFEDALQVYQKAVKLDPKFGLGYQGLAAMSRNLGRLQDAEKYARESLNYVASMTDRERIVARGLYYNMVGDYQQCVKEYGDALARYPADTTAHNQRAVCFARLRNMSEAVKEMREAVRILPKRIVLRSNLALFADYAGDFAAAEQEVRALPQPNPESIGALALSQLGQGLLPAAAETYGRLEKTGAWGESYAASGLADLALYEGHYSDAVQILNRSISAELAAKDADDAAMKLTLLAYVQLMRGQKGLAVASAEKALQNSTAVPIQFLAARVLAEAGAAARAKTLAGSLAGEIAAERQAFSKIIDGEIALENGDARDAAKILTDANNLLDTWIGHFDLGRAYLALGAWPQADGEFDRCIKRRGEALSLLDLDPTYGYFPPVYYYQGRAREGMKADGFADSYREYLKIRGQSKEDPLLPEVRERSSR